MFLIIGIKNIEVTFEMELEPHSPIRTVGSGPEVSLSIYN